MTQQHIRGGWTCPRCGRRFRQRTREHSCDIRSVAAHLDIAAPDVRAAFAALQNVLADLGTHSVVAVKTMIVLRAASNFGGVVVRRGRLDLGFILTRPLQHPRVYKTEALGARKYAHHVHLRSAADVDAEVVAWMREAYAATQSSGRSPAR
jgi:hypothetical protein